MKRDQFGQFINKNTMEIKGEQFGVRLVPRGGNDKHVCIQLLGEDDEQWYEHGYRFSSYWIDDLIKVLTTAKKQFKSGNFKKDESGYGFTFKG